MGANVEKYNGREVSPATTFRSIRTMWNGSGLDPAEQRAAGLRVLCGWYDGQGNSTLKEPLEAAPSRPLLHARAKTRLTVSRLGRAALEMAVPGIEAHCACHIFRFPQANLQRHG